MDHLRDDRGPLVRGGIQYGPQLRAQGVDKTHQKRSRTTKQGDPEMIWTIAQVLIGAALAYLGFIFIYEFLTTRLRNWSEDQDD